MSQSLGKIPVVGSDAHITFEIGRNYLEIPDLKIDTQRIFVGHQKARLVNRPPMMWPFLVTKFDRFSKKHIIKMSINIFLKLVTCVEETSLKWFIPKRKIQATVFDYR